MIATQYINLNMVPSGYPPVLYLSQYDVGRPCGFVVHASGSEVNLDTYTVTLEATRTDGVAITVPVTTSGNIAAFATTATMTNKADKYPANMVIVDGSGNRIASIPITVLVVKVAMDENAESIEEDASLYQQYTGTVQTLIAQVRSDLAAEASTRQAADNTLQSNINAEASARAAQDALLQSEIDQIIAPSGEAPSAAEVENARIGSDGTVYPTLGDAIRTQNSDLKNHIDDKHDSVSSVIPNLLYENDKLLFSSYSDNNLSESVIRYMPYFPVGKTMTDRIYITRIKLTVINPGKISFGYYPISDAVSGNEFNSAKHKIVKTVYVTSPGTQEIIFNPPLYIPAGNTLAIGNKKTDTLTFKFGAEGFDKVFYTVHGSTFDYSSNSLGIDIYAIDNYLYEECFLQLINSIIQKKNTILVDGYDQNNDSVSKPEVAPYFQKPLHQNVLITGVKLNVEHAGIITFGIYKNANIVAGERFDLNLYRRELVCSIENTGEQTIMFNAPIYVPNNYVFSIGSTADTCSFKFGANGVSKGFFLRGEGVIRESINSLGVTVYSLSADVTNIKSVNVGKKLSIYGDSISTFAGWVPERNAVYYTGSNAGVSNVYDTWWMKTIQALGFELLVNNSWSGRAVSNVRDSQSAHATDAGYKEANVLQLKDGTTLPDVIIIKLGINDFDYGCPLGDYDGSTALPTDPSTFTNAYAIMLNLIMSNYPLAKVYCCTLMSAEKNGPVGFPETNVNGDTISEWNQAIKQLASAFGASVLNHEDCGITYYNLSTYMGDWSESAKTGLHPNAMGHSLIANQTIHEMDNAVRKRF